MKDHNYLTSNNKVNGLIIEDAWRSREPYMTDARIWFGWHWVWVWQYLNNSDSPYTDGGGNQFALGCFYRSRWMSVISASSHFWGLMCYLFHVAVVYVLVGEIMSNHSYNFCMEGVLNAFFFGLFRWVTLDEMAFMSALHANQKPSTSAWHNHRAYFPYAFHLAMLPACWC